MKLPWVREPSVSPDVPSAMFPMAVELDDLGEAVAFELYDRDCAVRIIDNGPAEPHLQLSAVGRAMRTFVLNDDVGTTYGPPVPGSGGNGCLTLVFSPGVPSSASRVTLETSHDAHTIILRR